MEKMDEIGWLSECIEVRVLATDLLRDRSGISR